MGITPIGPLAMLQVNRLAEPDLEPTPMAGVEYSARAEDETYSPSKEDGDSSSGSRESADQRSRSQPQDYEIPENEQSLEGKGSFEEPLSSAAPSFELPTDSSGKISFFA